MIARTMTIASACLVAGLAFLASAPSAPARGLCNTDNVGTPPDRKIVAAAAVRLYAGGKAMMDSFAAYEIDERESGQKSAEAAAAQFKGAAASYEELGKNLKIDLRRLAETAPGEIVRNAAAAPTPMLDQLIAKAKQPDASQALMAECGLAALRMAEATDRFRAEVKENPNRETPFAALLAEWGRLGYIGRIVSVMFELGGPR